MFVARCNSLNTLVLSKFSMGGGGRSYLIYKRLSGCRFNKRYFLCKKCSFAACGVVKCFCNIFCITAIAVLLSIVTILSATVSLGSLFSVSGAIGVSRINSIACIVLNLALVFSLGYLLKSFGRYLSEQSSINVGRLNRIYTSLFFVFQHIDFSLLTHLYSKVFTVAFGGRYPSFLDFSGGVVRMRLIGRVKVRIRMIQHRYL